MSVDIFSFSTYKNEDLYSLADRFLGFLNEKISNNYVTNKEILNEIPSWVDTSSQQSSGYELINKSIVFQYQNTKFCVFPYITGTQYSNPLRCNVYVVQGQLYSSSYSFFEYTKSDDRIHNIIIGQNQDYFYIKCSDYSNYPILIIRLDNPVNPSDTNVFVTFLYYKSIFYNKPFKTESLTEQVRIFVNGEYIYEYNSSFMKNYYNDKIPTSNVYTYTRTNGIRGKISNLLVLPRFYKNSDIFININGGVYLALGDLDGNANYIALYLRCY